VRATQYVQQSKNHLQLSSVNASGCKLRSKHGLPFSTLKYARRSPPASCARPGRRRRRTRRGAAARGESGAARRAQNWRYKPHVQAKVDAAMQLLGSKPKPTIAFHARGGDKRDEDIKCARAGSHPGTRWRQEWTSCHSKVTSDDAIILVGPLHAVRPSSVCAMTVARARSAHVLLGR